MTDQPHILVLQGVNLDLLGRRDPHHYGSQTLSEIHQALQDLFPKLLSFHGFSKGTIDFFQSNHEGEFLNAMKPQYDGFLINAGAWTHTSLALGDRLEALKKPVVEVHLSNLSRREPFRQKSYVAPHAQGVIYGLGPKSYEVGLYSLLSVLKNT